MNDPHDKSSEEPASPAEPQSEPAPVIRSEELLRGTREVLIQHAGELYRLRLTRNGKLILQK